MDEAENPFATTAVKVKVEVECKEPVEIFLQEYCPPDSEHLDQNTLSEEFTIKEEIKCERIGETDTDNETDDSEVNLENTKDVIEVDSHYSSKGPDSIKQNKKLLVNDRFEILKKIETAKDLVPEKSRQKYEKRYKDFMEWRASKNITSFTENVLLVYFQELAVVFKSSTLWLTYSMLRTTLKVFHQTDISKYTRLVRFLKIKSEGYEKKKSKTFSPEEINTFINEAPNETHLLTKIALIFGIIGGCRRQELYELKFSDVQDLGSSIAVRVLNRKSNTYRTFIIYGKYYTLCNEYMKLRPNPCTNPCFFLTYMPGKRFSHSVGINKFGSLGKHIAEYLNLPDAHLYTGHCFRRTSATVLINAGGEIACLKARGGQKSFSQENKKNTFTEVNLDTSLKFNKTLPVSKNITATKKSVATKASKTPDKGVTIRKETLTQKSRQAYEKRYKHFMRWRRNTKMTSFSEKVLLSYFQELANKFTSSTLWLSYSMLKATLNTNQNVDISKYPKLYKFLKRKSEGYEKKTSKTFSPEEITRFLNEAPDNTYLLTKVALIFGIMGGCRRQELHALKFNDVHDGGTRLIVNILNTNSQRVFTITGKYYKLCQDYIKLRPKNCTNLYFFLNYINGKCHPQNVGINKFGILGKVIAKYLDLPDPSSYTGHCFRRTFETLLIDAGGDITSLKECGGTPDIVGVPENMEKDFEEYNAYKVDTSVVHESITENEKLSHTIEEHITRTVDENKSIARDKLGNQKDVEGTKESIPEKSKEKYEKQYKDFMRWRMDKNVATFDEDVLLTYFQELANKFKSSTLWSTYSMLKTTLIVNHRVDISKYAPLLDFLKCYSQGHESKQSSTFSPEEINTFINEAPNRTHLLTKVALIFGIMGGCRRHELHALKFNDVLDEGYRLVVTIPNTHSHRAFAITGKYYKLCEDYIKLRPENCTNPYFFLNYASGKCIHQNVGINKFGNLGKVIAQYLNLPDPNSYTGHCFRRTSATLLIDADGDIRSLTN